MQYRATLSFQSSSSSSPVPYLMKTMQNALAIRNGNEVTSHLRIFTRICNLFHNILSRHVSTPFCYLLSEMWINFFYDNFALIVSNLFDHIHWIYLPRVTSLATCIRNHFHIHSHRLLERIHSIWHKCVIWWFIGTHRHCLINRAQNKETMKFIEIIIIVLFSIIRLRCK